MQLRNLGLEAVSKRFFAGEMQSVDIGDFDLVPFSQSLLPTSSADFGSNKIIHIDYFLCGTSEIAMASFQERFGIMYCLSELLLKLFPADGIFPKFLKKRVTSSVIPSRNFRKTSFSKILKICFFVLLLLLASFPAFAVEFHTDYSKDYFSDFTEEITTDRPKFNEGVQFVPPQSYQIESGYTFNRTGNRKENSLGEVMCRVGMSKDFELRLGINSYLVTVVDSRQKLEGWTDSSVGFKYRIQRGRENIGPAICLIMDATLPTGAPIYTANVSQSQAKLVFEWPLSKKLNFGTNLDLARRYESSAWCNRLAGGLSFDLKVSGKTRCFLEFYGIGNQGKSDQTYVDGGAIYRVSDDYQLDIRYGHGINGTYGDYFTGLGFGKRMN
ncbi:MAG: transporter [Candidatus Riflebacteria bacterium]|nr:transporter [Candidatus Riflebacteria bacterium]